MDIKLVPVVPESTEAHFIPCHTLCARRQKGSRKVDISKVPMKTRILVMMLLMFSTCEVTNAADPTITALRFYDYCRSNFPSFFGEVDTIISNPSKTEFYRKGLVMKLPRLTNFRNCLNEIDFAQAHLGLGGGTRLATAVEHARIYLDSLVSQAPPAATPQNEIQSKP